MKKKVLSILLALCLIVGCLPLTVSAEDEWLTVPGVVGGKVCFDSETGYIVSFEDTVTSAAIPDQINGVTVMGFYLTFTGSENLTFITIPSGATDIFTNGWLNSIGKKLTAIEVAPGNTAYCSVGGVAFSKDNKTMVAYPAGKSGAYTVPNNVTTIGESAFSGCDKLSSVTIPNNVTSIGELAFSSCSALTSVNIPDNVSSIGKNAFMYCRALTSVTIPDSVTRIGNGVFFECSSLSSVTIGEGVTSIGNIAFSNCSALTSVNVPNGVTTIDTQAFSNCSSMTSITIPDTVTQIKNDAFSNCPKLTISGKKGSYAETYAKENGIPFTAIGGTAPNPPVDPDPVKPDPPKPTLPTQFTDVPAGEYYVDAVKWAIENGVTTGTSATKFSPNNTCTRAQAVTFLWRAAGSPEPASSSNPFTDVKSGEYYYKAVLWAVEKGITNGATKTTFNPDGKCIREQIVTFLYRAEGSPAVTGGTFTDVAAGSYYENAVKWAVANDITNGTSATKFSPKNNCTRGQIVTFLYRYSN